MAVEAHFAVEEAGSALVPEVPNAAGRDGSTTRGKALGHATKTALAVNDRQSHDAPTGR